MRWGGGVGHRQSHPFVVLLSHNSIAAYHLRGHHDDEVVQRNLVRGLLVDVREHLSRLLLLDFEAQRAHRGLELAKVDRPTVVRVEQLERFADLLKLLLAEIVAPALAAAARRCGPPCPSGGL